ncbi:hypothetical protein AB7783_27170 [Tardiphaga sp. 172_B4_N1_3]|jgi:hypothetical protein|uniref:hypothetical protein n=1 Tax=Tardiphaga sp. 172_B4_N1_3 TaxID=3240787 RepID=UPI003F89A0D5
MASIGFPLLLIPVAICNIIAFLMPDLALSGPIPLFPITLMSKDIWMVTLNDLLVALSILLLWLEVMRAARPAPKYFTDHFLSLLVFGAAATEFVMLPKFGNATFFLITLTAMVDFLAGISLRARRPRRVAAPVYAPEPAPRYEPAPAPVAPTHPPAPVPAATSVAEAVLTDRPEPKVEKIERIEPKLEPTPVPPEVVAHTSPQITSPDLQPGGVASPDDKPKT